MKNILVTGGAGFIGSHVVDELLRRSLVPTIFDRLIHFHPTIADVKRTPIFYGDVTSYQAVLEAVGKHDGVIHLAGRLGTAETINDPVPSVEVNTIGALNVFQACREHGVPAVYIAVGNHWMNNSYSISKTSAERFALMFNTEHDTRIAVVRGMNAFGPRQLHLPVKKIIPTFVVHALRGDDIPVYGDGSQRMDMIFVEDLARVLVDALVTDHGCYDSVMEAGTGEALSVKEIAEAVIEASGSSRRRASRIKNLPMRAGEPEGSVVVADLETLAPLGDYSFKPFSEAIVETVEWYRKNYDWQA